MILRSTTSKLSTDMEPLFLSIMRWSLREDTNNKLHISNLNNPDRDPLLTTTLNNRDYLSTTNPDMERTLKERTDTKAMVVEHHGHSTSMFPEINNNNPECTLRTQEATSRWEARDMWSLKRSNPQPEDTKMILILEHLPELSPSSRMILRLPTDSTPETENLLIWSKDHKTTKEATTEEGTNPEETILADPQWTMATRHLRLQSWNDHHYHWLSVTILIS
jgi:hypothetical protein